MTMKKYAIGIDFGTLSARAVLARLDNGEVVSAASYDYPHGVMDLQLPCGKKLTRGWSLQHPKDYLEALEYTVPNVLQEAGAEAADVAALGIDFTCSTNMPTLADGTPLCFLPEFEEEPNAYVKLWKHHAEDQAAQVQKVARDMQVSWLKNTGNRISSEWPVPKLLQIKEEAPAAFEKTAYYLEAGEWLVWLLTGTLSRSANAASIKNFYEVGKGYAPAEFYAAVDPALDGALEQQFKGDTLPLSQCAGYLTDEMAKKLGLEAGIPIAPFMVDAQAGFLSAGLWEDGEMITVLGTSACHLLLGKENKDVMDIAGKAPDGLYEGLVTYEGNQPMGENLAWFIEHACPAYCYEEAREKNISVHQLMNEKAAALEPGANGLIVLDWLNGNRCILGDSQLSGMILGLTLQTKPEAIYRAMMEGSVYTMRSIVDNFESQGLKVDRIVAVGGMARKSPMLMQIVADVLGREVHVSAVKEAMALGAAIVAAAAGGVYPSLQEASRHMGQPLEKTYYPGENKEKYEKLYQEFWQLHNYFGRGGNEVMHRLAKGK
ncbi:MAG: ribulokinase [Clostridiales bacterium]|nr:ribulokinase [Clostridiales bacterium]